MKRLVVGALLAIGAAAVSGCGDDDEEEHLTGTTACEKWKSLALRVGCDFPTSCNVSANCQESAIAWLECTAQDLRQCMCDQMSLQLDCSGSHQSSNGPALCTSEYDAFNRCQ